MEVIANPILCWPATWRTEELDAVCTDAEEPRSHHCGRRGRRKREDYAAGRLRGAASGDASGRIRFAAQAFQVRANFGGDLVTHLAVFLQRLLQNFFELGWNIRIDANGRGRHAIQDGFKGDAGGFAAEGHRAGGHFVQHGAERKKIAARVEFLAANLFGRHVGDGAHSGPGAGEHILRIACGVGRSSHRFTYARAARVRRQQFCQAEIENFRVAAAGDEKVGGLDVAMNDALGVRGVQRVGDFDADVEQAFHFQRAAVHGVLQRGAVEKFHGDEGFAVFFADIVDGANAGMVQRGGGLRFALKTPEGLLVARNFRGQEISARRNGAGACLPLCKPRPCRRRRGFRRCGNGRWFGRSGRSCQACARDFSLAVGASQRRRHVASAARLAACRSMDDGFGGAIMPGEDILAA